MSEVDDAADVEREVAEHARLGVDAIKFVSDTSFPRTLSRELIRATIEAAHSHNLRVYGHIEHSADAQAAIEFGLDALSPRKRTFRMLGNGVELMAAFGNRK